MCVCMYVCYMHDTVRVRLEDNLKEFIASYVGSQDGT